MNNEILKTAETHPQTKSEIISSSSALDDEQIDALVAFRKNQLESIKNQISLKAFYNIEEKILSEEKRLREILDLRRGKQKHLSKYTFILDPKYFEQEFIN